MGALTDAADRHRPRTVPVRLCPDQQLADDLLRARQAVLAAAQAATTLDATEVQEAKAHALELQAQVDEVAVTFVLQQIPRPEWRALKDAHQPPKSKRDLYRDQGVLLDHDPDTFPPAAVAACLIEPREDDDEATVAAVKKIFDTWGEGECERLWQACLAANIDVSQVPKSSAVSDTTSSSAQKSEPPMNSGSLGPSSSDAG